MNSSFSTNATAKAAIGGLFSKIIGAIIVPILWLMFSAAVLVFIWGALGFVFHGDDPKKREEGQQHIIWGITGFVIMLSAYGIIRLIAGTIGMPSPF